MISEKGTENVQKFYCEKCNFTCSYKYYWDRHIITPKHTNDKKGYKNLGNLGNLENNEINKEPKIYECKCGKKYKYQTGLSRHKPNCDVCKSDGVSNTIKDTEFITQVIMKVFF